MIQDDPLAICNSILPIREQNTITNIALNAEHHPLVAARLRKLLGIDPESLRQDVDKIAGAVVRRSEN